MLAFGMVTSNIPTASALTGLNLVVDYTPDSAAAATSALRGTIIDLTASTPVAVAGTTQQEIVQQIDPELDLRSASDITAPSGWTIYYSTDGVTYSSTAPTTVAGWEAIRYVKANGPLVSEGADANGRQIASTTSSGLQPDSGQFSISGGSSGDGWDVTFDNTGHFYNVHHHQPRTSIDCHLRTGARCDASWPYSLDGGSMSANGGFELAGSNLSGSWFDSVQNELWFPTIYRRNVSGVEYSTPGFGCLALTIISAATKWCGGSITTGFVSPGAAADYVSTNKCADSSWDCYQGLAHSAGRLFTWNVKTGDLICIDIRLNSGAGGPCATGGLIDFGASLPEASNGNFFAYLGEWGGRIYGATDETSGTVYGVCVVALTGAACPGWTNPRVIVNDTARFGQLPATVSGGAVRGACFFGRSASICFDAAGVDITSSLTASFLTGYQNGISASGIYSNFNPTYGTRMYWGAGQAGATGAAIRCWDFALDGWCTNWTSAGIADENYQIVLDPLKPTCLWSNDNTGQINTFNTTLGIAGNCAVPAPTVEFSGGMTLPRMACSTANAIQAWRSFTLVTAVTYTSATFTVKNSSGVAITAWTNVAIPANKIVNLAALPVADTGQSPTFSVSFNGRSTEGDVSATISAIGGSPELCLRPVIACPTPIVHPSQLTANTVNVVASGSTTASSVVSQFDSVTRSVNIATSPSSSCASSLSGTLTTGAGVAVAGVVVALTDSAGAAATYQDDYPDVSLRGQPVTATSDASGNYVFPLVAPGNYKVKFVDASGTILVNQAIVTASGSGTTTDFTAATSLLSPIFTLVAGTPGVVDAKYNSFQTLTKSFWPAQVAVGQVSTLTFTINNPALSTKTGIGWVDSLPTGLVVDDNPNIDRTCATGTMTAVAGAINVSVSGAQISAGVASCTFRVNVKATAAGDYRNGPTNVTTTAIDKNTDARVSAVAPTTVGATLCDNNPIYLDGGQLYRQVGNSLTRYPVGPTYQSGAVDAIGYNSVDGRLYGIARTTVTTQGVAITAGHLVRYSGNGILTDLGSMTGSSITDTVMATAVGGDFDNSGNLVVKATGSRTTLYSINVTTREVTTITTSVAVQGDDLAYAKGYFYSTFGSTLYKTGVSAGTNWTVTALAVFPTNYSGHQAIFGDGLGQIVSIDGNRSAYLLANPLTVTAASNFVSLYSYSSNPLDGAMCHAAPVPVASPDTSSGGKNVVQTKNLLTNDSVATNATGVTLVPSSLKLCGVSPVEVSPNCTKGSGTSITVANVGAYSVDALGVVTFTPVNNYLGTPPALNYQVSDSIGNIATSTYTPTVLDTLPTANDDSSSGPYNTSQIIDIADNDTAGSLYPLDNASIKLCAVGTPDNSCTERTLLVPNQGTYSANPDGTVTFVPFSSFKGTATPIKYTILDTGQQLTTATIATTVTAPAAPVATSQSKSVIPGGTATFTTVTGAGGLATAAAGLNASLTCLIVPASSPAICDTDGIVEISGEGVYTLNTSTGVVAYVADTTASVGPKTAITYRVTDITGQTATSTLTPIVPPAPTADNETSTGAYNTPQTIDVLTGDAAGAGATLNASSVKLCAEVGTAKASCTLTELVVQGEGTYKVNANGTITFTPLDTFKGQASFVKYVVADSTTQLAEATIRPTVSAPAAPIATAQSKSVIPGATATFTTITGTSGLATAAAGLNASLTCLIIPASNPAICDADGIVEISGEGKYTLNTSTGVVTYVADSAATAGSKTVITYQVTDITGQKAIANLTPVIPPAPTADNETSSGAYNTPQTIDVLTGDAAGSGATLNASTVKLCATTSTANASCNLDTLPVAGQGVYTVNPNGTVTFTPYSTFSGDASPVKYAVADSTGQFAGAEIRPTVALPNVPVAASERKAVIPGGTATFTTITGTGALATSGVGLVAASTCLLTPNTTTCAPSNTVSITGEGVYTLNPSTGVVTFVADPAATQGDKTSITYQVTDTFGQKVTATLTPVIPAPPAAVNDSSNGAYNTAQVISILTNDTVTSPATLVASTVKLCATTSTANASCNLDTLPVAGQGVYTVNPNGTVTFTPYSTFSGAASPVKYVVADSTGQLTGAQIFPTVGLPDAPVATAERKAVIPGGTATFTTVTGTGALATSGVGLVAASTCLIVPASNPAICDADGIVEILGQGTFTLNPTTGVVTYVADSAATQGDKTSITYQVTDTFGQKASSTLTPVIPAPPAAVNDLSNGAYNTAQVISILTNDTVTSPATLVASTVKLCATTSTANASCALDQLVVQGEGTYKVNANGTVTFTPYSTFSGPASPVKYAVADSTGQLTGAQIFPTVGSPEVPAATPQSKTVIPGGTATFTTLTGAGGLATAQAPFNASLTCLIVPASSPAVCDADGIVEIAGEGVYTLNPSTGIVTFVADPAATVGQKTSITYQVTDIFGQTAISVLTPIVPPPPTADNETSTGAYNSPQVIDVLTGDAAGAGATLNASSVKLCATVGTAKASCTLTELVVQGEGTYKVNANGTVTFTPLDTFKGQASFVKYVVADSTTQLAEATIRPFVSDPAAPVATPQSKTVIPGGTATFTTLTGTGGLATAPARFDTSLTCLIVPASSPAVCDADGIVEIAGEGTYTLNPSTGIVTFVADRAVTAGTKTSITYKVTDIFGQTAVSTLTPIVPEPLVIVDDSSTGPWNTSQKITPLTNDKAGAGSSMLPGSVQICATAPVKTTNTGSCSGTTLVIPGEGTYKVATDGTVRFVPLVTFWGNATPISYSVTDNNGQVALAIISVVVQPPKAPVAKPEVVKVTDVSKPISFTTLTGSKGLAASAAGLNPSRTCLIVPASEPAKCDTDGVVVMPGEGTYKLDKKTGSVTFLASALAKPGKQSRMAYQVTDKAGQKIQSFLMPILPDAPKQLPVTGATNSEPLLLGGLILLSLGLALTRGRNALKV